MGEAWFLWYQVILLLRLQTPKQPNLTSPAISQQDLGKFSRNFLKFSGGHLKQQQRYWRKPATVFPSEQRSPGSFKVMASGKSGSSRGYQEIRRSADVLPRVCQNCFPIKAWLKDSWGQIRSGRHPWQLSVRYRYISGIRACHFPSELAKS